jgi:hypothetical protein
VLIIESIYMVALSTGEAGDRPRPHFGEGPKLCKVNWLVEKKNEKYTYEIL